MLYHRDIDTFFEDSFSCSGNDSDAYSILLLFCGYYLYIQTSYYFHTSLFGTHNPTLQRNHLSQPKRV